MNSNLQYKIQTAIIVILTILAVYLFQASKNITFCGALFIEVAILATLTILMIFLGNKLFKANKQLSSLIINIFSISSLCIIISYLHQYYVNNYCNNMEYIQWVHDTVIIKTIIIAGLFNLIQLINISSVNIQQKTIIQEPVQIYQTSTKDAELTKLRHQINPHFLFNALNSINALMQFDKDKARNMIVNLSQYYRNIINVAENDWHTVEKELNDIKLYCNIEKIRFGHRLEMDISCDESLNNELIPPLLYQPLVENAIKYGLYDTIGNIVINIKIYRTHASSGKEFVTFQITNPFDHNNTSKPQGTGFGLNNIQKRLYLLFATYKLFTTKIVPLDEHQSLYHAYLSIPINNKKTDENKNTNNR